VRILPPRAQSALDRLNALGACLTPDFSAWELRQAFRTLARRYHPDRHPASNGLERARLSQQFIQLHNAYRELQTAAPIAA
jgi:DnaJ-class molecular chaperone